MTAEPIIYGYDWAALDVSHPDETYCVQWHIYEIFGLNTDTNKMEYSTEVDGEPEAVESIADAPVWAWITIKWDGCSHLNMLDEGYFHVCGPKTWKRWNEMIMDLFRRSAAKMGNVADFADEVEQ